MIGFMLKLLACDLDGTLVGPSGEAPARVVGAIEAARDFGLEFVAVTGRPPRRLAPIMDQIGWQGWTVAANGAALVELGNRVVEQVWPIAKPNLDRAVERIRKLLPGASFAAEYGTAGMALPGSGSSTNKRGFLPEHRIFGREPGYPSPPGEPQKALLAPAEGLVRAGDVIKLLVRVPRPQQALRDQAFDSISRQLTGIVAVTSSDSSGEILEVSHADVSKATGLASFATFRGYGRMEIAAVGDMINDLPMLVWAGQGWAVANAHPKVLASVGPNRVLPTQSDSAVAVLIEKILTESESSPKDIY